MSMRYSLEDKLVDSRHSIESCLMNIIHEQKTAKEEIIIPPTLHRQLVYLMVIFAYGWALGWGAVSKQSANPDQNPASVYVMIGFAAASPFVATVLVQYFYDGGYSGLVKIFRRLHPSRMPRIWWIPSFLSIPSVMGLTSAVYVWFGGPAPETQTLNKLWHTFLISLPIAIGEELGWRGMMLPDTMRVFDGWYYSAYGNCIGNDGVPYWESDGSNYQYKAAGGGAGADERDSVVDRSSSIGNNIETTPFHRGDKEEQGHGGGGGGGGAGRSFNASMSAKLDLIIEENESDNDEYATMSMKGSVRLDNDGNNGNPNTDAPHWKWSPICASMFIGIIWGTWCIPAFFITTLHHQYCNFFIFMFEAMFMSIFYTWQSNRTHDCILAAVITHTMQQTFRGLDPWGDIKNPPFTSEPNVYYQLALMLMTLGLVVSIGPELGREPNRLQNAFRAARALSKHE